MPTFSFVLNGESVSVDAPGDVGLLYILRDLLKVNGPKYGCGVGVCRACTCLVDDRDEIQTCITPVSAVQGRAITTIEGLADGEDLHPLQEAWLEHDVAQCGFCQAGQIMTAAALLRNNPQLMSPAPTQQAALQDAIDGIENVCRCGTYPRIRQAITAVAATANPSEV